MSITYHRIEIKFDKKRKHVLKATGSGQEETPNMGTWNRMSHLHDFHCVKGGVVIMSWRDMPEEVLRDKEAIIPWLEKQYPEAEISAS